MIARTILHVNIVNYFVTIARLHDRALENRPVAVRASGAQRVLLDVSQEALCAGVTKGMIADTAKRICPDLVITDPAPHVYEKTDNFLLDSALSLSPQAELAGPGHVFIDLSGTTRLHGNAVDAADKMRKNIKNESGITCSLGIASNRLVSKVATRVVKPDGLCTVVDGCEYEFMNPLPLTMLPGVDTKIITQLHQFNIHLIRDLVKIPLKTLYSVLGPAAEELRRRAQGIDNADVMYVGEKRKTVDEEVTFGEKTNDSTIIAGYLFTLVSNAGARIRAMGLAAGMISLSITYTDGATAKNTIRPIAPVRGDLTLYSVFNMLLKKTYTRRIRLASLAISCDELTFAYGQLDLFNDSEREEHLMTAIDTIRNTFGVGAIGFGTSPPRPPSGPATTSMRRPEERGERKMRRVMQRAVHK
jgi:DNA polymerase-4